MWGRVNVGLKVLLTSVSGACHEIAMADMPPDLRAKLARNLEKARRVLAERRGGALTVHETRRREAARRYLEAEIERLEERIRRIREVLADL
jgi:hypothetical protein